MSKRSQVSFFLVFALLLVVLVSLVATQNSQKEFDVQSTASLESSIPLFVESCLRESLEQTLPHIGMQGGYYAPQKAVLFRNFSIAIYLQDNATIMPSLQTIESQISLALENRIGQCIDNFDSFRNNGIDMDIGERKATTTIESTAISVVLRYPITIISNNEKQIIDTFSAKIDFDFPLKYNAVRSFEDRQAADPTTIPLSALSDLAVENGFLFDIVDLGDKKILFVFSFKAEEDGKPFIYAFAHKYT